MLESWVLLSLEADRWEDFLAESGREWVLWSLETDLEGGFLASGSGRE